MINDDDRYNLLGLAALLIGTVLVIGFLTALANAKGGEIAAALGSIIGGIVGAGGAGGLALKRGLSCDDAATGAAV